MPFRNSCSPSVVPSGCQIQPRLAAGPLVGRALDDQARTGRVDLVDQLDLAALERTVQLLGVGVLKAELGRGGRDFGVRKHTDPQTACDQTLDLFKLAKIRS